jgi:hypothetical protein
MSSWRTKDLEGFGSAEYLQGPHAADDKMIELAWTSEGVICYNRVEATVLPIHQEKTT